MIKIGLYCFAFSVKFFFAIPRSIDLSTFLIVPKCPKFHAYVQNDVLLLCWKTCVDLHKKPFKWKDTQHQIQVWLSDRKATHNHVKHREDGRRSNLRFR